MAGRSNITSTTDVEATMAFNANASFLTGKGPQAGQFTVDTGGYIKMGTHQYIIFGTATLVADVQAAATAVDASCRGSIYITNGDPANVWLMRSDTAASPLYGA